MLLHANTILCDILSNILRFLYLSVFAFALINIQPPGNRRRELLVLRFFARITPWQINENEIKDASILKSKGWVKGQQNWSLYLQTGSKCSVSVCLCAPKDVNIPYSPQHTTYSINQCIGPASSQPTLQVSKSCQWSPILSDREKVKMVQD